MIKKGNKVRIFALTAAVCCSFMGASVASARTPLMVNEDAWYFIGHRPAEEHTVEGLQKHIDRYAEGGKVTHMCFCVNGMRTAYPTKVGEPMWRTVLEDGTVLEDAKMAYRTMFEKGIDPFKVWIDRCREKRISPWISMRINDVHHVTTGNPRSTCAFWRKHPELRCTPNVDPTAKGYWWTDFAYDYAQEAVREYQFALFKEIVDRYDADGYELDTLRFDRHFRKGHEREDAHFLTEFIRRCRTYAKSLEATRGHAIRLSARVLTSYEASRALGFDAEEWARTGAVDLIVVCNFFSCIDYEFDLTDWLVKIREANPSVKVLPGATDCFDQEPCRVDAAAYRGWADQMYSQGACGLYLYNTSYLSDATKADICREGLSLERVRACRRRYPRTHHECVAKGLPTGRYLPVPLDVARKIPVVAGGGASEGDAVEVVVGLGSENAPAPSVSLNGIACAAEPVKTPNRATYGQDAKTKTVWHYPFAASALKSGADNVIEVGALDGKPMLRWVETAVTPK